jgi:hypothetical protein
MPKRVEASCPTLRELIPRLKRQLRPKCNSKPPAKVLSSACKSYSNNYRKDLRSNFALIALDLIHTHLADLAKMLATI